MAKKEAVKPAKEVLLKDAVLNKEYLTLKGARVLVSKKLQDGRGLVAYVGRFGLPDAEKLMPADFKLKPL